MKSAQDILLRNCNRDNGSGNGRYYKVGIIDAMEEYAEQFERKYHPLVIVAREILDLHLCEQKGITRAPQQWLDAVDRLYKALKL